MFVPPKSTTYLALKSAMDEADALSSQFASDVQQLISQVLWLTVATIAFVAFIAVFLAQIPVPISKIMSTWMFAALPALLPIHFAMKHGAIKQAKGFRDEYGTLVKESRHLLALMAMGCEELPHRDYANIFIGRFQQIQIRQVKYVARRG